MPRLTPLPKKKWEQFLRFIGCTFDYQKDDHIHYTRSDLKRPVIFQDDAEIAKFIIQNNLKTLGISREEYFEILAKI